MVDEVRVWPTPIRCFKGGSSHMTADTLEELHAMARRLRLKSEWFQEHSIVPHYDLTPDKRARAIALGAAPVSAREQAKARFMARGALR